MLSMNAILSLGLLVSMAWALYMASKNHQRFNLNNKVAEELDAILQSVLVTVEKGKHRDAKAAAAAEKMSGGGGIEDIHSPDMLATLLTVLIHKYGLVRLSITDFKNVSQDEFVSIYVDTKTNDLILSLNQDLQDVDQVAMAAFSGITDDTFH